MTCYVSPDDPRRAFLERAGSWYLGLLPLALVYGVLYTAFVLSLIWRRPVAGPRAKTLEAAITVSPLALVGLYMIGLGAYFGWNNAIGRVAMVADMDDWRSTDCSMLAARASWTFTAPEGDLPVIVGYDVLYSYSDGTGRAFLSNRYDAFSLLADEPPAERPGSTITCGYDPDRLSRSVLRRGYSGNLLVAMGTSLVTLVSGLVVVWLSWVWVRAAYREQRRSTYGSCLT